MECPKCKHHQEATDKCESCGVYFSKLAPQSAGAKPTRAERTRAKPDEPRIGIGAIGITAFLTALVVFAFVRKGNDSKEPAPGQVVVDRTIVMIEDPRLVANPDRAASSATPVNMQSEAGASSTNDKPLEAARNATVLIE